jgi:hypothetical protein
LVLAINLTFRSDSPVFSRLERSSAILQVIDGITLRVFRMLNELGIEAIETDKEQIADEVVE